MHHFCPTAQIGGFDTADELAQGGSEIIRIGVVERIGFDETIILYDTDKIIKLLEADGMSNEEATEYFQYNILGAYMGKGTPAFATLLK